VTAAEKHESAREELNRGIEKMTVPELVAYLKAKRGITAAVEIEASPNGRAYGRFVENGKPWPKETTFAIRPNGNVFDLAFFKTYKDDVVKTCDAVIYSNLPPHERRGMGYGPASPIPADNGGHAGYAAVIDALDGKLREDTPTGTPGPQTSRGKSRSRFGGVFPEAIEPTVMVRPQPGAAGALRRYFETEGSQLRALQACRDFLGAKDWPLNDRLRLYDYSRTAFDESVSPGEPLHSFRRMYDELLLPAPAGGWGVGRNASGPLMSAEKTFETIRLGPSAFARGGPVTLPKIHISDATALLRNLDRMKELKPIAGYPVMAVSKFLHPYNPELFAIYDNEVIGGKVIRHFKNDFRAFCFASNLPDQVANTAEFYVSYILWGASLLRLANPRFMEIFADWLANQPGANLTERSFDASRLYATAYEFTIIGAYADLARN
jgi:hypothetical protein